MCSIIPLIALFIVSGSGFNITELTMSHDESIDQGQTIGEKIIRVLIWTD
ncbi:hypothetical protein Pmar_PMAR021331 [Perkinsus marinus ATCC 50983]|uniref:Uncharacterized protein n=1 Tax=Perkinsus marinus (strain ATCC 50983 / TXsc) TaxID=423536 RepID=C5LP78_PERM5|nr:hypothetical protein Pmar_PMAR021331 [Perkinsus marinus ATCC 50983]EER01465.1 hypothetical protein Pmar_PMAR021331 [Perkinsus marinus ATCC 50983]|eukprot:XP_002768747.1 hypothetical protein Pmar_PMAR021331 [Perkinsus marinus ATCC 50983]